MKVQIGDCTLYLGDCMDIMSTLGPVDAVVTDPPYGINENTKKNMSRGCKALPTQYGDFNWDKSPVPQFLIDRVIAAGKSVIMFGGNYYQVPPTKCWLVWDKLNGSNDFADCELAWTNLDKAVRIKRHLWNGMIRAGEERGVQRVHPTQKPVAVMQWCIEQLPAGTSGILDPFMGSGTTGVACVKLGRKFIGIEKDPQYFEIACKRIREAYAQPDLFVNAPEKPKQDAFI